MFAKYVQLCCLVVFDFGCQGFHQVGSMPGAPQDHGIHFKALWKTSCAYFRVATQYTNKAALLWTLRIGRLLTANLDLLNGVEARQGVWRSPGDNA